jgi:hypothetical protein
MQPRPVATAENELGNEIRRPPSRLAERIAQFEKIFAVLGFQYLEKGRWIPIVPRDLPRNPSWLAGQLAF